MVAPDSDSTPIDPAIGALPGPPSGSLDSAGGPGRRVGMAPAAGLLAGIAAWLAGESILEVYQADLRPGIRRDVEAEAVRRFAGAHLASASGTFAALGAILGLGLGLAGGLSRRSAPAGAGAALLGCAVGSIAGVSSSLLVLPNFFRTHDPQSQDLVSPMLALGSICSAVGAAGGLAFGIGLAGWDRRMRVPLKSLMGGLMGAALATAVYELAGAIAFPTARTELPISHTPTTRAMLHVLVATLAAVGSALAPSLGEPDAATPGASGPGPGPPAPP